MGRVRGHTVFLTTHICRPFTGRYEAARSTTYPVCPYLSCFAVRRSGGVLARLGVDACSPPRPGPVGLCDRGRPLFTNCREEVFSETKSG